MLSSPGLAVHETVKRLFPPLHREAREEFLKKALTFITVREPFVRLLSAYNNKLRREYEDNRQEGDQMAGLVYFKLLLLLKYDIFAKKYFFSPFLVQVNKLLENFKG